MIHKLTESGEVEFVFVDQDNKFYRYNMSLSRFAELIEEKAYDAVTEPVCTSSSCAVNGFCECDPLDTEIKLHHFNIINK